MSWRPFFLLTLLVASLIVLAAWMNLPSVRDGAKLLGKDVAAAVKART